LINITLEEDVKKPLLFLLWLVRQIPGLVKSGINWSLKGLERAGDELESLSWEVLWLAAIRIEQGTMQVRHRLFGWTDEGAGAAGGNRLLWMKERKVAINWKEQRKRELSEAVEEEKRDADKEEEEEQSLDVKSQIGWWDTRADDEPDPISEQEFSTCFPSKPMSLEETVSLMKSDCEDSTTLEEKGAEVFDYSYGDIVKSRIQWFEQLKESQTFAPKPVTGVWSCWEVPNHVPGAYGQKFHVESPPTSNNISGREEIAPPEDDIWVKALNQDNSTTVSKSVQFEVNVGQDPEVEQEKKPSDSELISGTGLKAGPSLDAQQKTVPATLDSIAGPTLKLGPSLEVQQQRRPADPGPISGPPLTLGSGAKADPESISGPSLKSGPGLLKSPMLVSQVSKADMMCKERKEILADFKRIKKGQS